MKKWLFLLLTMVMLSAGSLTAEAAGKGVLALGDDLIDSQ